MQKSSRSEYFEIKNKKPIFNILHIKSLFEFWMNETGNTENLTVHFKILKPQDLSINVFYADKKSSIRRLRIAKCKFGKGSSQQFHSNINHPALLLLIWNGVKKKTRRRLFSARSGDDGAQTAHIFLLNIFCEAFNFSKIRGCRSRRKSIKLRRIKSITVG